MARADSSCVCRPASRSPADRLPRTDASPRAIRFTIPGSRTSIATRVVADPLLPNQHRRSCTTSNSQLYLSGARRGRHAEVDHDFLSRAEPVGKRDAAVIKDRRRAILPQPVVADIDLPDLRALPGSVSGCPVGVRYDTRRLERPPLHRAHVANNQTDREGGRLAHRPGELDHRDGRPARFVRHLFDLITNLGPIPEMRRELEGKDPSGLQDAKELGQVAAAQFGGHVLECNERADEIEVSGFELGQIIRPVEQKADPPRTRVQFVRQGDHRFGDVDSDHRVEPGSQGVSEPPHAASEVERASAPGRNAEAGQLREQLLHLRPTRGEELLRIPLPSGFVVLAENRPKRVAAGVALPDARHLGEPLCRRRCVGGRGILVNRHVVQTTFQETRQILRSVA